MQTTLEQIDRILATVKDAQKQIASFWFPPQTPDYDTMVNYERGDK